MSTIINTTPHAINIVDKNKMVLATYPKSADPIRLDSVSNKMGTLNNVPVYNVTFGTTSLPDRKDDVYFIVSALVKNAFPDRSDLLIPFDLVRDDNGNIVGCKGFSI